MEEDKMIEILEGLDVDEDKTTQIVSQLSEQSKSEGPTDDTINDLLDFRIDNERDWKKKASLIAKRISKRLDE